MMRFVETLWLVIFLLGLLLLGAIGTWDEAAPFWYGASLVAISGVGALLSRQRPLERRPGWLSLALMLVFYAYIAGRALTSEVKWLARQDLIFATTAVITYLLITLRFTSPRQRGAILTVFAILILGNVITGLYQFHEDQKFMLYKFLGTGRTVEKSASGFYVNSNHMAGFLMLSAFPLLGVAVLARGTSPFLRMLCGLFFALCGIGIVYSTSRGGAVAFFSGLLLFIPCSLMALKRPSGGAAKEKKKSLSVGVWFSILTVGFFLLLAASAVVFRKFYGDSQTLTGLNGRGALWDAALEQWQLRPFMGTGARSFEFMERGFRTFDTTWMTWAGEIDAIYAHNDVLQCLGDYGLIGFLLALVVLIGHSFHSARGIARQKHAAPKDQNWFSAGLALGSLCSAAGLAVHSLVDFNLHIGMNVVAAGAFFGFMANPGFAAPPTRTGPESNAKRTTPGLSWALVCLSALTAGLSAIFLIKARTLAPADHYWAKGYRELKNAANDADNMSLWLKAGGDLQNAVNLDPDNPMAWRWLGFANAQLATQMPSQFADTFERKALDQLIRSLELYPQNPYAAGLAGSLADYFGEHDRAEIFFSAALRWGVNILTINHQYGDHLAKYKKEYKKAIPYYWMALSLSSDQELRADLQRKINVCLAKLKELGEPAPPEAFLKPGEVPSQ